MIIKSQRTKTRIEIIRHIVKEQLKNQGAIDKPLLTADLISKFGMAKRTINEYINMIVLQENLRIVEDVILE